MLPHPKIPIRAQLWCSVMVCAILTPALRDSPLAAQDGVPPGYTAIPLKSLRADEFAVEARNLLKQLNTSGEVLADRERNRILVKGGDSAQQLVADLAAAIDKPSRPAPETTMPAQGIVRGYPLPAEQLDAAATQLKKRFANTSARIALDRRTSQLIVVGPADVQTEVGQAVREYLLANVPTGPRPAAEPQLPSELTLQNITWRELEDALRAVWGKGLTLTAAANGEQATLRLPAATGEREILQIDRRTNRITFAADDPSRQLWTRLVMALDAAPSGTDQTSQLVALRNADPRKVQRAVSLLRSAESPSERRTVVAPLGTAPAVAPRERLAFVFQQEGQPQPQAAQPRPPAAGQPAAPQPPGAQQPAAEPGAEQGLEDGGLIGDVRMEFIPELGITVITGHKRDVERVQKLIEEIEKQSELTQPEIEVFQLQHANSVAMGEILTAVYDAIFLPRQGAISITPLSKPNAILLVGRRESLDVAKDLITKLDQPVPPRTAFEVFQLQHITATTAQQAISTFFEEREALGSRAVVVAETRSNSLIVQAAPRDLSEVRGILQRIDVATVPATKEVRIFKLRNALAADLATVLQSAISGQAATGPGAPGGQQTASASPAIQMMLVDPDAGKLLRSGILADVQVNADANSNALIVAAPTESMDLMAALIEKLDALPGAEAQIKVFTIENGDATSLAATLQQLFGQQVTIGVGSGGLFGGALGGLGNQFGQQATTAASGESSLVPLRFAIDVRTNSIIVSGSTGDLAVVEILLTRLDEGDVETRRTTVFRLKNAPAQDVAASITQYLNTQSQLISQRLLSNLAISPFEQIEREVIVVPELVSNSLIVSATPRYYEQIIQVIEDLDFRPPMVMVQVLLAEVTLDDSFEFGVEMGLQDSLLFNRGIASLTPNNPLANPGFNFNNGGPGLPNLNSASREQLGPQGVSNFGVGRTSPGAGYGGLVLSAANESINVLLRALQETGRLQILSRPQVMALNNQMAFVQVGDQIPRITSSQINNLGNVINSVVDVETGLILRIQPRINDDGLIVMNVDAERSFLDSAAPGVDLGNGVTAQPIRRTTAQTTISAKDGQTVVFAGLIVSEKALVDRSVPYLSKIPILGHLFHYEQSSDIRRELLIVLTPHVVQSDEDYERIKAMESERMSWCLADVINVHGDVGLQGNSSIFCNGDCPVIYPDVTPTVPGGPGVPYHEGVPPPPPDLGDPSVLSPVIDESASRQPGGARKANAPAGYLGPGNPAASGGAFPDNRGGPPPYPPVPAYGPVRGSAGGTEVAPAGFASDSAWSVPR